MGRIEPRPTFTRRIYTIKPIAHLCFLIVIDDVIICSDHFLHSFLTSNSLGYLFAVYAFVKGYSETEGYY